MVNPNITLEQFKTYIEVYTNEVLVDMLEDFHWTNYGENWPERHIALHKIVREEILRRLSKNS